LALYKKEVARDAEEALEIKTEPVKLGEVEMSA